MGFRDKAVHEYFNLDLAIVWKTIKKDIPKLHEEFDKFIRKTRRVQ